MKNKQLFAALNRGVNYMVKTGIVADKREIILKSAPDHQSVQFGFLLPTGNYAQHDHVNNADMGPEILDFTDREIGLIMLENYFDHMATYLNDIQQALAYYSQFDPDIIFSDTLPEVNEAMDLNLNQPDLAKDVFFLLKKYILIAKTDSDFIEDMNYDGDNAFNSIRMVLNEADRNGVSHDTVQSTRDFFNKYQKFFALLYGLALPIVDDKHQMSIFDFTKALKYTAADAPRKTGTLSSGYADVKLMCDDKLSAKVAARLAHKRQRRRKNNKASVNNSVVKSNRQSTKSGKKSEHNYYKNNPSDKKTDKTNHIIKSADKKAEK